MVTAIEPNTVSISNLPGDYPSASPVVATGAGPKSPAARPWALKQFLDLAVEDLVGRRPAVPVSNVPLAVYDYGGAQAKDPI